MKKYLVILLFTVSLLFFYSILKKSHNIVHADQCVKNLTSEPNGLTSFPLNLHYGIPEIIAENYRKHHCTKIQQTLDQESMAYHITPEEALCDALIGFYRTTNTEFIPWY